MSDFRYSSVGCSCITGITVAMFVCVQWSVGHVGLVNCTLWLVALVPPSHTHTPTHTHSTGTLKCCWRTEQRACSITCSCSTHSCLNQSESSGSGTRPSPSSTRTAAPSQGKGGLSPMWLDTSVVIVSPRASSFNTSRRRLR